MRTGIDSCVSGRGRRVGAVRWGTCACGWGKLSLRHDTKGQRPPIVSRPIVPVLHSALLMRLNYSPEDSLGRWLRLGSTLDYLFRRCCRWAGAGRQLTMILALPLGALRRSNRISARLLRALTIRQKAERLEWPDMLMAAWSRSDKVTHSGLQTYKWRRNVFRDCFKIWKLRSNWKKQKLPNLNWKWPIKSKAYLIKS